MTDHTVDSKGMAYQRMAGWWPMIDALQCTAAMREAGETYLPREPKERKPQYERRVSRSWLYGAYQNTVLEFADAPFQKPVTLKDQDKLADGMDRIDENADLRGRTLTQFGRMVASEGIHRGLTHMLPDYPPVGTGLTRGQITELGVRPYISHISPTDLFGWSTQRGGNFVHRVRSFRVHETAVVPDGAYGEATLDTIRVYNLLYPDQVRARAEFLGDQPLDAMEPDAALMGFPGTVEIWQREEDAEDYAPIMVTPYSFVGYPLVTYYTRRVGFLEGVPALQELAEKNVEHWQSSSDQRNLLRIARVPFLTRTGVSQAEIAKGFTIGPVNVVDMKNPNAKMGYVEHTGAAIDAGKEDIERIEEQMEVMKLRPRMRQTGDPKATVASIGEARGQSALETWANDLAEAITTVYRHLGQFATGDENYELPDGFAVDLQTKNLALDPRSEQKVTNLLAMREAGEIDRRTFLNEVKTLGALSEEVNVEGVVSRLEEESNDQGARFLQGGREPDLRAVE